MAADLLDTRFGARTVRENLDTAVADGRLIRHADGTLELARAHRAGTAWIRFENAPHAPCVFLHQFLFNIAYNRSAVPAGCRDCYKVKVLPQTMRQLSAARDIAAPMACRSKWGPEVDLPHSTSLYGGYFYTMGLERARQIFRDVRRAIDTLVSAGSQIPMVIKRGCSEYEHHCGPSDRWTFRDEQPALEEQLRAMLRPTPEYAEQSRADAHLAAVQWMRAAHRIGDMTYLEFTSGVPVYPATVTYDPEGE